MFEGPTVIWQEQCIHKVGQDVQMLKLAMTVHLFHEIVVSGIGQNLLK